MTSMYEKGYKYCSRCGRFWKTEDVRCPVCHGLLRAKPRRKRWGKRIMPPEDLLVES